MTRSKKIMAKVGDYISHYGSIAVGLSILFGAFSCLGLIYGFVEGVTDGQWTEFWFFTKSILICVAVFTISLISTVWGIILEEKARKPDNRNYS